MQTLNLNCRWCHGKDDDFSHLVCRSLDDTFKDTALTNITDEWQLRRLFVEKLIDVYCDTILDKIHQGFNENSAKEWLYLFHAEYEAGEERSKRLDYVIQNFNFSKKLGIQLKFYRLKGATGKSRGQPNYVTQIMNDLYELPQYFREDFKAMYFVLLTEDKRMAERTDYPVQAGAKFPTNNNLLSIAEGTVISPKNGSPYILKWLQEDNVLTKVLDRFAVLPVYLKCK